MGRAPHGARGLKLLPMRLNLADHGRAPHGARGLKHEARPHIARDVLSRPAWGAWIETVPPCRPASDARCRAPHGARGLKLVPMADVERNHGRAPHRARGLKPPLSGSFAKSPQSRPAWGAWIETIEVLEEEAAASVAPRMGRVD